MKGLGAKKGGGGMGGMSLEDEVQELLALSEIFGCNGTLEISYWVAGGGAEESCSHVSQMLHGAKTYCNPLAICGIR